MTGRRYVLPRRLLDAARAADASSAARPAADVARHILTLLPVEPRATILARQRALVAKNERTT